MSGGWRITFLGNIKTVLFVWQHLANRERRFRSVLRYLIMKFRLFLYGRDVYSARAFPGIKVNIERWSYQSQLAVQIDLQDEYSDKLFWKSYLRAGDAVIDVGANIGIYSLLASYLVGPEGHVYAFEPGPKAYSAMLNNFKINDASNVTTFQQAVGDHLGTVRFHYAIDTTNRVFTPELPMDGQTIAVPQTTLTHALPKQAYAILKIDVEGAELQCLKGAEQLFEEQAISVCQFECQPTVHAYGYQQEDIIDFFATYDYIIFNYINGYLVTFDDTEPYSENLLGVASSALTVVQSRINESLV